MPSRIKYCNFALQPNQCRLLGHPLCKPSRFYPLFSGRDHFKAVRGPDVWKFFLILRSQNVWIISVKKLAGFCYAVGIFLPWKFKLLFLRIFKLEKLSDQSGQRRVFEVTHWRVKGQKCRGELEEIVCWSEDGEVSSAKTEVCNCKKKLVSINQL